MMPTDAVEQESPALGVLLIASFWFLAGSFGLVFTMAYLMQYSSYLAAGLFVSLGLIFLGWGLLLLKPMALALGAILALLISIVTLMISIGGIGSLVSNPTPAGLLVVVSPLLFFSMMIYLIMKGMAPHENVLNHPS